MFLLDYQKPGRAADDVARIYDQFKGRADVPGPLQLLSASPELLRLQFDQIGYFMRHERLTFPMLAAIRFLASQHACFDHCRSLNRKWLTKAGLTGEDLENLDAGADAEAFSAEENALLRFVRKMLAREVTDSRDIQELRAHGWRDSDILDACAQGTALVGMSILFDAFAERKSPDMPG